MTSSAHAQPHPPHTSSDETRTWFVRTAGAVRPRLHRFCARMSGSALDGEDLVQETLAQALAALPTLEDATRFEPWLFRIAHHKCVDFLRRDRRHRDGVVTFDDDAHAAPDEEEFDDEPVGAALAALVGALPPMERASVLLKDVLDYRLHEIAEIVDSTLGGVKAALHRGRTKLRDATAGTRADATLAPEERALMRAYLDCFNRRDWDALRRLVAADARLEIIGAAEGPAHVLGVTYQTNYAALPYEWRLALAMVDDEPALVVCARDGDAWQPRTAIRLAWHDGLATRIRDYRYAPYLLENAMRVALVDDDAT